MKKSQKLTIEEALKRQRELVEYCKSLGNQFKEDPNSTTWKELMKAESHLNTIHLALLTANETYNNNARIKERELLVRKLDVIRGSVKAVESNKTKLGNMFTRWFNKLKRAVDVYKLQQEIQTRIDAITQELTTFNRSHFIEVQLL